MLSFPSHKAQPTIKENESFIIGLFFTAVDVDVAAADVVLEYSYIDVYPTFV